MDITETLKSVNGCNELAIEILSLESTIAKRKQDTERYKLDERSHISSIEILLAKSLRSLPIDDADLVASLLYWHFVIEDIGVIKMILRVWREIFDSKFKPSPLLLTTKCPLCGLETKCPVFSISEYRACIQTRDNELCDSCIDGGNDV